MKVSLFILLAIATHLTCRSQDVEELRKPEPVADQKYSDLKEVGGFLSENLPANTGAECHDVRLCVLFVVDTAGKVNDVSFVPRACDAATEAEIAKVIRRIPFKPFIENGKAVKVQMKIPIAF